MKSVIFAGGMGTRLWPLSRRKSPKQFENIIGEKSTIQLAVERLAPDFSWQDIFVSTGESYVSLVKKQLPNLHHENIIGEPETRDVGPAVGLITAILYKKYKDVPMVILWSDHIIKKIDLFKQILKTSEKIIKTQKDKIIFISQKPRFASQNLGWIRYDKVSLKKDGLNFYKFDSFYYSPNLSEANRFINDGKYSWNLGYFVTTTSFLWRLYEKYQPEIFSGLKVLYNSYGTKNYQTQLNEIYPKFPKISFDKAILEKIDSKNAYVVSEDLGWSDVGAWEALKEALQSSPDQNVINGKVLVNDCRDSLVYNYTDQLVVSIDLDGFLVINTHDVVLICHKNSVPKIKKLVKELAESKDQHLV